MSYVREEIASQPTLWRRAAERAGSEAGRLPAAGQRVAIVGCGTSLFMAEAWAAAREQAGLGETDAFTPSESVSRDYDVVVLLTRSGTNGGERIRQGASGRRAKGGDHGYSGEPDRGGVRRHRAPRFRRRAFGRADALRDDGFGPVARAPRRGHRSAGRPRRRGTKRSAASRLGKHAPGRLSRSRYGRRGRTRGGTEVARGGRRLDRGLSLDRVPTRTDQRNRRRELGVGVESSA